MEKHCAEVYECEGLNGGKLYHINDGYYYAVYVHKKNVTYLRCKTRSCKGGAKIVSVDGTKILQCMTGHSDKCKPDLKFKEIIALRKRILERCKVETTRLRTIFREECNSVDSDVAAQLDLSSMKSSMKRARKARSATEMEPQDSSRTSDFENGPSTSTSNTQFGASDILTLQTPEFGTLEESEMDQSNYSPTVTPLAAPTHSQEGDGGEGKEKQMSSITLADIIQTAGESGTLGSPSGVKVKPIDALQSKQKSGRRRESKTHDSNQTPHIEISVKTLQAAILRLETVTSKLNAISLADSYDQFGKYISTVLRGLPAKKVHTLKQKIITEVMEVLAQEESGPPKHDLSKEIQSNLKFVIGQSQAKNFPVDPKSVLGKIPIRGNMPLLFPGIFTSSTPHKVPQEVYTSTATRGSPVSVVAAPPTGTTPRAPAVPVEAAQGLGVVDCLMDPAISPPKESTSLRREHPPLQEYPSPRSRKRRKTSSHTAPKLPAPSETSMLNVSGDDSSMDDQLISHAHGGTLTGGPLSSQDSSRDSGAGDLLSNVHEPMKSEKQDFEIDIEEGNELARIKEDQENLFETVICGDSTSLYIKEEAPDPEESSECDPGASPPPSTNLLSTAVTCPLCNTRCNSRDDLTSHFSTDHPGCPLPTKDVSGVGFFVT